MDRGRTSGVTVLMILVSAISLGNCLSTCGVEGQARRYLTVDPIDKIALAKMCVHEGGWLLTNDDCDAIYAVLLWRSTRRGVSIAQMSEMYGPRVFDESRTDPEAWKVFLTDDDNEPKFWPDHLSWPNHVRFWRAMRRRVDDLLSRRRIAACVADHWGAPGKNAERARRRGLLIVNCGATKNIFYMVDRLLGAARR